LYDKKFDCASIGIRRPLRGAEPKEKTLLAVAYFKPLPVTDEQALIDVTLERPKPQGLDLPVEVKAVSVNPVDTRRRLRDDPMFSRTAFATPDMARQHTVLNEIADLVDAGKLRTTLTRIVGPIRAAPLWEAHAILESGATIGKLALEGSG
jgi:NADPH:quinone reductase-like Zn-dependent oxidoreductase